jgi:hypothetical protein
VISFFLPAHDLENRFIADASNLVICLAIRLYDFAEPWFSALLPAKRKADEAGRMPTGGMPAVVQLACSRILSCHHLFSSGASPQRLHSVSIFF